VPSETVLVVEDEPSFVEALVAGLRREGFVPKIARTGREALALFDVHQPDLVLLDVMLPGMSGIDVCRELRRRSEVPIIMVSAKASEIDMVIGLEVGADDYVSKPYRLRELVARIRAALRRAPPRPSGGNAPSYVVGDVRLDRERHEVTVRGEPVDLPLKEFEILEVLLANAGRVVTREGIVRAVWSGAASDDTRALDTYVKRLRAKIEDDPAEPRRIVTVRGLGYRYEL